MGKAKPAKHTTREIMGKIAEATTNKGGGKVCGMAGELGCILKISFSSLSKAGQEDRLGGKGGHAKFQCHICKTPAPSLKSMQDHHESKHPTLPWEPEKCTDVHAVFGGTTQGVAVRGTVKKVHH